MIRLLVLPNGLSAVSLSRRFSKKSITYVSRRGTLPKKSRLRTEKSAKSYDWASEKCARSPEGFALKIQSGMLRNIQE
jgi:hypothetical protein